ncbi:hypothetical protein H0I23_12105 [Cellulophaga sp. HaHaR_3_176]|uniref:hypothetical protein n=1 Tax=Cellulophaga sp. HaHaR_3_176 TaxID=1942464 RepID=UPI001C1F219B|nr:hypothetical protein [Cellulophaga sp. HaHaR_3_176]QWX83191.1 hypothetical protein H0I23_12105 [Cellulophaga sp. HaHaR_3_176]
MNVNPVLSVAKLLVKNRKLKLVLLGAQFGYLGYKILKKRKRKNGSVEAIKA